MAVLLSFVLAFFTARGASAQEIGPAPPSMSGPSAPGAGAGQVGLALPSDIPLVAPGQVTIPPVPSRYVTKELGWITISYPPNAYERVEGVLRDADLVKSQLALAFGHDVLGHVELRVVPNAAEMAALAPVEAPPPSYAAGVAYPRLHLTLISMLPPQGAEAVNIDQVFRHELMHLALEDAVGGRHVPAWFNEGLAVLFADENGLDRQRALFNATISGTLLPLSDLDRGFPSNHFDVNIAYAESVDFVAFLRKKSDDLRFARMITRVREGQPFERAIAAAYGSDLRKLEFQWRGDLERRFSVIPILAGGGLLWVLVIGALGWGWHKKRKRAKAILARWAEEEAIEDALAAAVAANREEPPNDIVRLGVPRPPTKVEHGGRVHTLH
ncbi:MAG: hypothetical protein JST00_10210 [Deltaproteobacteria bacterium]|nr:hypothetical protein [Deltaproteobacteria bacterium]